MMLGVPLMQLVLFGYAINSDPEISPAVLVSSGTDQYVRAMVSALELTNYYRFVKVGATADDAEAMIASGKVSFVVTIPSDFATRVGATTIRRSSSRRMRRTRLWRRAPSRRFRP